MNTYTTDSFFNGRIQIKQNKYGYRFSIDAVILAHHANPKPGDKVLDLGTGCGVIPLILLYRYADLKVYGIEIQKDLFHLASLNVQENSMDEHIRILYNDIKSIKQSMTDGPVDLIVCNPPYRRVHSGRINPNQERAIARHEIKMTLADVVKVASSMLRTMGKIILIYPAERITDVFTQLRRSHIEPKSLCTIHSKKNTDAKLIIVEGVQGGGPGIKIAPPLIIYNEDGTYNDRVDRMFQP